MAHPSRSRLALLRTTALAGLLLCTTAGAAGFPGQTVPDPVLAQLRGGLEIGGLRMDLTARLRTYVDERLAAATEMQITRLAEGKARMTSRMIEAGLAEPPGASQDSGSTPNTSTSTTPTAEGFQVATESPASGTPANGAPVVSGKSGGATRIDHVISPRQVISSVANTANHRRVEQSLELELQVHNFRAFAAQARDVVRARALGRALAR